MSHHSRTSPGAARVGDHLRRIALTVEEAAPGCFRWLLLESTGDAVVYDRRLAVSGEPCTCYASALKSGQAALLRMSRDIGTGPRACGEDEQADPVVEAELLLPVAG